MFRSFNIPLSWGELFKRTLKETQDDNGLGLAAQLAYYFLLALVPALIFVVALASLFPAHLIQNLTDYLSTVAPGQVMEILRGQLDQIRSGQDTGLLTFGIVAALWSSSSALVAIVDAMNRAYDIEEGRSWLKVRLTAVALTLALAVFMLTSLLLVLAGPTIAEAIASRAGLGSAFEWTWKILQWPLVAILVTIAVGLVNYFAPDADQDWEWVTPGAVLSTVLWLVASLAFRFYVTNFGSYNETYGSLGGVIVLMLWFYISGLAIIVGAEMNAEIEHAAVEGKAPGEKAPGERKRLGAWKSSSASSEPRDSVQSRPVAPHAAAPPPTTGGRRSIGEVVAGVPVYLATRLFRKRRPARD